MLEDAAGKPTTCLSLVIATRLHLGNASAPPSSEKIRGWIQNLRGMADSVQAIQAVVAVDATPKIEGYNFVKVIEEEIRQEASSSKQSQECTPVQVLPVTPWGKFVPALNALVFHSYTVCGADQILFVSAEVSVSETSIRRLCAKCSAPENILVAGAALSGHLYSYNSEATGGSKTVALNGRTCPWNTLAVWNLAPLSLTGFLQLSDIGPSAGVEECLAIATHQTLFPDGTSKARLVKLDDVSWESNFGDDEERKQWHERKMNSKLERAGAQLDAMNMSGTVDHS